MVESVDVFDRGPVSALVEVTLGGGVSFEGGEAAVYDVLCGITVDDEGLWLG